MEGEEKAGVPRPAIPEVRHVEETTIAHKPCRRRLELQQPAKKATPDPRSGKQYYVRFFYAESLHRNADLKAGTAYYLLKLAFACVDAGGPIKNSPSKCARRLNISRKVWSRVQRELIDTGKIIIDGDDIVVPEAQPWIDYFEKYSRQNTKNINQRYIGQLDDIEEAE